MHWQDFAQAAPEIANVGKQLLYNPRDGEVGILATISKAGAPKVAPVCPFFSGGGIWVSLSELTPKTRNLRGDSRFALHAMPGADDLEFQISGCVSFIEDPAILAQVRADIPFASHNAEDPIIELLIHQALVVTWETPGKSRKQVWRQSLSSAN